MFELTSGAVYVDGLNIREMGLHDLRVKIAVIPQGTPKWVVRTVDRQTHTLLLVKQAHFG